MLAMNRRNSEHLVPAKPRGYFVLLSIANDNTSTSLATGAVRHFTSYFFHSFFCCTLIIAVFLDFWECACTDFGFYFGSSLSCSLPLFPLLSLSLSLSPGTVAIWWNDGRLSSAPPTETSWQATKDSSSSKVRHIPNSNSWIFIHPLSLASYIHNTCLPFLYIHSSLSL